MARALVCLERVQVTLSLSHAGMIKNISRCIAKAQLPLPRHTQCALSSQCALNRPQCDLWGVLLWLACFTPTSKFRSLRSSSSPSLRCRGFLLQVASTPARHGTQATPSESLGSCEYSLAAAGDWAPPPAARPPGSIQAATRAGRPPGRVFLTATRSPQGES